jgi:hypothetical protein
MAEFALVGPADEIRTYSRHVRPDVETKPGWRWLPVERSEEPYDPATELLESETVTVAKDRVRVKRAARARTAEEREEDRNAEIETALPPLLAAVLTELDSRIRVLEGKQPRSQAEFKAAVRELLP